MATVLIFRREPPIAGTADRACPTGRPPSPGIFQRHRRSRLATMCRADLPNRRTAPRANVKNATKRLSLLAQRGGRIWPASRRVREGLTRRGKTQSRHAGSGRGWLGLWKFCQSSDSARTGRGAFSPLEGEMVAKQPEGVGQGSAGRKNNVEHCRNNPTRRLRRHPPLKGEGNPPTITPCPARRTRCARLPCE